MNLEFLVFRFWNGSHMFYKELFDVTKEISYVDEPMICIGVRDKNGVRIFEGDLVRFVTPKSYPDFHEEILPITVDHISGCHPEKVGIRRHDDWCWWLSEVVGNIYEGKKLK